MKNADKRRRVQDSNVDPTNSDSYLNPYQIISTRDQTGKRRRHSSSSEYIMKSRRRKRARRKARLCLLMMLILSVILPAGIYSSCRQHKDNQSMFSRSTSEKDKHSVSDKLSDVDLEDAPLSGKIIFLDAGHGGSDNGCSYPQSNPTYLEKDYNLKITLEAQKELEKLGATVVITRQDDSWLSLYARAAIIHVYCIDYWTRVGHSDLSEDFLLRMREEMTATIEANTDQIENNSMGPMVGSGFSEDMIRLLEAEYDLDNFLFLSIHNNWNNNSDLHGTQVYYVVDQSIIDSETRLIRNDPYYQHPDYVVRDPYYGRDGDKNASLAQIMYDSITRAEPALVTNTPQIVEDNFAVLREHGIPSVMLELTFVSNPDDRNLLEDSTVITNMSKGIADGCLHYFGSMD